MQDSERSYIGPYFWGKTLDKIKHASNFNTFEQNLKKYFSNKLKSLTLFEFIFIFTYNYR